MASILEKLQQHPDCCLPLAAQQPVLQPSLALLIQLLLLLPLLRLSSAALCATATMLPCTPARRLKAGMW